MATVDDAEDLEAGWAQVSIETNAPPTSGSCGVTLGESIVAQSEIRCSSWTDNDEDLPLSYQFGYLDPVNGLYVAMTSFQSTLSTSMLLPIGNVRLEVHIMDNKGAETTFTLDEIVVAASAEEVSDDSVTALLEDAQQEVAQGDVYTSFQGAILTLSLLDLNAASSPQDSTALTNETRGTHIRSSVFNLTRLYLLADSTASVAHLAISLMSGLCSDSSELGPAVQQGSMEVLADSVDRLVVDGELPLVDATRVLYSVSQVMKSVFNGTIIDEPTSAQTASNASSVGDINDGQLNQVI